MNRFVGLLLAVFVSCSHQSIAMDTYFGTPKKITDWKISCSVDKGAILGRGNNWTFKNSKNRCSGGVFSQRAEISSKRAISISTKAVFDFQTIFDFKSGNYESFDIFQLHDGRDGCAPPLKVNVQSSGRLKLYSDYKTGPGEQCVRDVMKSTGSGRTRIKRDGTQYKLNVYLSFDGKAGFVVDVYLDDKLQVSGKYTPPTADGFIPSKYFYFKHGVYSKNMFDFEMKSNMTMKQIPTLPPKEVKATNSDGGNPDAVLTDGIDKNTQAQRLAAKRQINTNVEFRSCLLAEGIPPSYLSAIRFSPFAQDVPMFLDDITQTECFSGLSGN